MEPSSDSPKDEHSRTILVSSFDKKDGKVAAGKRRVGYSIHEAVDPSHRNRAILWFYALSGASVIVKYAAPGLSDIQATVLCVDRPGIGYTQRRAGGERTSLDRIQGHAEDVLHVLKHHSEIQQVYLMGVCLGHVYAVQVARRLLHKAEESGKDGEPEENLPTLKGLTLVSPFVSTACPQSWRVARLGASVPHFVLSSATYSLCGIGSVLNRALLTPARIKTIIDEEQQETFGWSDDDFDEVYKIVLEINQLNQAKAVEANLGADPSWQQVIDDFAVESGCGLRTSVDDDVDVTSGCGLHVDLPDDREQQQQPEQPKDKDERTADGADRPKPNPAFPIRILSTELDKISPLESVKWVAQRNYGGNLNVIELEDRIHSHEGMTMMGGPPRNPVLLLEIAHEWNLVVDDNNDDRDDKEA